MENKNYCEECGSKEFYFRGKKKVCSKCGNTITILETKKKCKVVGCKNVEYEYGNGYCRQHYDEIEKDKYRTAREDAKEIAEKKGEEFDEQDFRERYKEKQEKDIKIDSFNKLNKTLFEDGD